MSADGAAPDDPLLDGWQEPDEEPRRRRLLALLDAAPTDGHRSPNGDGVVERRVVRDPEGLRARLTRLCEVAQSEVGVDGAGVTVMGSRDGGLAGARDQLAATGALTRRLEELQLTTGEGPCLDAYATGVAVLVADLVAEQTRWLAFGHEAITAGAGALFSFPLQVGAVRLGTLDLCRTSVGGLSRDQLADALALAGFTTEALLEHAEPDPDAAADTWSGSGWLPDVHGDVHVASGMVSVQAGIDVGAALLRLRGYAFAHGEPLHEVARRVIEHSLVVDQADDRPDELSDDFYGGPPALDAENDER